MTTPQQLPDPAPPPAADAPALWRLRPLSLLTGVAITVGGSIYPFAFARPDGTADHNLAMLAFWAMSAGLVNGVGFTPRFWLWRGLFSGWACLLALGLAAALKWG